MVRIGAQIILVAVGAVLGFAVGGVAMFAAGMFASRHNSCIVQVGLFPNQPWMDLVLFPGLGTTAGAWLGFVLARQSFRISVPDGFCACGYDLTGNVSGVCPECGTRVQ